MFEAMMAGIEDDFVRYVIAPQGRRRGRRQAQCAQRAVLVGRGPGPGVERHARGRRSARRARRGGAQLRRRHRRSAGGARGRRRGGQRRRSRSRRRPGATSPATAAAARSSSSATAADAPVQSFTRSARSMRDFTEDLTELRRRVPRRARVPPRRLRPRAKADELEAASAKPDLWDDPDRARSLTTELARVKEDVDLVDGLEQRLLGRRDAPRPGARGGRRLGGGRRSRRASPPSRGELDGLELRALFTRRARRARRDLRGALRRGWDRRAGLGRDAAAHVHPMGRASRLRGRGRRGPAGHRGRASRRRRSP